MKKLLIATFFVAISALGYTQTSVWYFGYAGGLKFFSNGSTAPQPGSVMHTNEGCTVASDINGNVLFYTDGDSMWHGGNNSLITSTMLGSESSTQAAMAIPI